MLGLCGGEIHYNQRSGGLASIGIIIKTPMKVQCRITPNCGFSFPIFYVLEEPFANLAVGKGFRDSRMSAYPWVFALSQAVFKAARGQNEILSTFLGERIRSL